MKKDVTYEDWQFCKIQYLWEIYVSNMAKLMETHLEFEFTKDQSWDHPTDE